MRRVGFVLLAVFLATLAAPAQTDPGDSQTLKSLLAEVRLLRRDMLAAHASLQRGQILLHRLDVQQGAVDRATGRRDMAQGQLVQAQTGREQAESEIAQETQAAQARDAGGNSATGVASDMTEPIEQIKSRLEFWMQRESENQNELNEAEEQLRIEEAKMAELQEQLERMDQALAEERAGS